jgi:hypothetical protein
MAIICALTAILSFFSSFSFSSALALSSISSWSWLSMPPLCPLRSASSFLTAASSAEISASFPLATSMISERESFSFFSVSTSCLASTSSLSALASFSSADFFPSLSCDER